MQATPFPLVHTTPLLKASKGIPGAAGAWGLGLGLELGTRTTIQESLQCYGSDQISRLDQKRRTTARGGSVDAKTWNLHVSGWHLPKMSICPRCGFADFWFLFLNVSFVSVGVEPAYYQLPRYTRNTLRRRHVVNDKVRYETKQRIVRSIG